MSNPLSKTIYLIFFVFFLFISISSFSQIRLPGFFADHMVLQQQRPIRIWGSTLPGEWVRVSMENRVTVATADENGNWVATIGAMEVGGPYELVIKTPTDTLTLTDVWVGEVWLCVGQSNMEWPLRRAENGAAEIAIADFPQIRYLKVPRQMALQPVDDFPASPWTRCHPETVLKLLKRQILEYKKTGSPKRLIGITGQPCNCHNFGRQGGLLMSMARYGLKRPLSWTQIRPKKIYCSL